jgi:hypothetical protein
MHSSLVPRQDVPIVLGVVVTFAMEHDPLAGGEESVAVLRDMRTDKTRIRRCYLGMHR